MRKRMALLSVAVILVSVTVVFAGWQRIRKRTFWTNTPTDATCWTRDSDDDVRPVNHVQVFDTTVRYIIGGISPTNTSYFGTGLWRVDEDGDYRPIDTTGLYDLRKSKGIRKGIEWEVDSDGDIRPKE